MPRNACPVGTQSMQRLNANMLLLFSCMVCTNVCRHWRSTFRSELRWWGGNQGLPLQTQDVPILAYASPPFLLGDFDFVRGMFLGAPQRRGHCTSPDAVGIRLLKKGPQATVHYLEVCLIRIRHGPVKKTEGSDVCSQLIC